MWGQFRSLFLRFSQTNTLEMLEQMGCAISTVSYIVIRAFLTLDHLIKFRAPSKVGKCVSSVIILTYASKNIKESHGVVNIAQENRFISITHKEKQTDTHESCVCSHKTMPVRVTNTPSSARKRLSVAHHATEAKTLHQLKSAWDYITSKLIYNFHYMSTYSNKF